MKAVFVAAVLLAGCSGAPSTPDAMSDPPPNEPAKLAPAGPDVVDDSINPRAERPVEGEEPTAGAAEVTRADVQ